MPKRFWNADTLMQLATGLLLAVLLFGALGDTALLNFNEARRAVTAREMLAAHDWLIPLMNGQPYLTKPPMFYWLVLLVSSVFGAVSEWTARFPSALFGCICCLWVYRFGSQLRGRRAGLLAAIFMMANAGFSLHARSAEVEMTLTGFCVSSLMVAALYLFSERSDSSKGKRWILLSYALMGACITTKGPVSLVFTALPIAAFWLCERSGKAGNYLTNISGWSLTIVVGGGWFLAVSLRDGFDVWQPIIHNDIVNKIAGNAPADRWYAYIAYMLGDFFPFWMIVFVRPRQLWQQIRRLPTMKFLVCAIVVPLMLLSFFSVKNPKYLLPMYPWLALLLAIHWDQVLEDTSGWRRGAMLAVPMVMLAGFVGFYLFMLQHVLAHRIQALPQIKAAIAHEDRPVYHIGKPDMRLVFYVGRPVTAIHAGELDSIPLPALLFVEAPGPTELPELSRCAANHFKPYLSKRKELVLYWLDQSCLKR